jgi:hypothetical protein
MSKLEKHEPVITGGSAGRIQAAMCANRHRQIDGVKAVRVEVVDCLWVDQINRLLQEEGGQAQICFQEGFCGYQSCPCCYTDIKEEEIADIRLQVP